METRVDKLKRLNKGKRRNRLKYLIIIGMIVLMYLAITIVNNEAKRFDLLENPILFNIDFRNNKLILLGEKYYFDFKIIKKQI